MAGDGRKQQQTAETDREQLSMVGNTPSLGCLGKVPDNDQIGRHVAICPFPESGSTDCPVENIGKEQIKSI